MCSFPYCVSSILHTDLCLLIWDGARCRVLSGGQLKQAASKMAAKGIRIPNISIEPSPL